MPTDDDSNDSNNDAVLLDMLLHEDFREIGRSGVVYTKANMLGQLPTEASPADIVADRFELRRPGDAVALLTYRLAHRMRVMLPPYSRPRPIRNKAPGQPLRPAAA